MADENAERIALLNEEMAKSDLPYHTAETEKLAQERAKASDEPVAEEPQQPAE